MLLNSNKGLNIVDIRTINELNLLKSELVKTRKQRNYFENELKKSMAEKKELMKLFVTDKLEYEQ